MTPLESMAAYRDGHLLYRDIAGNEQVRQQPSPSPNAEPARECQVYLYKHGKAVCFGSGFEHATQPSTSQETKAFLCFTFGTDKFATYWDPYIAPPKGPPLGSSP